MLLLRQDFPQDGDLVLCTVTNVQFHSVFVTLDEYNKPAMIHISEIAPGRIRNIRDYVVEGKKIICVVLRVNKEKGHIDISLRRVNEMQKRAKLDKIKQEQKAEKIIEVAAKELKTDIKVLYKEVFEKVSKKYDYLCDCFQDIVTGNISLDKLGIKKDFIDVLNDTIKQRIKENTVIISGDLSLSSFAPDGIEIVKESLQQALKSKKGIKITYKGGGKFGLMVESKTYKEAEAIIEESANSAIKYIKEHHGEGNFARAE